MDADKFAVHLIDQLRRLNRGQYLMLVSALREAGGSALVSQKNFAESVAAPLPVINMQVVKEGILLKLDEAHQTERQ